MKVSHFKITLNRSKIIRKIRKRYLAGESQRQIAKALGISRNTVKKYCEGNSVPWERKTPVRESTVLTDETIDFIRQCLEEDKTEGLKKQRHTAKRIYDRLVQEKGFIGGESTVRAKVHELKDTHSDAFIPLQFDPGEAMQVDWGEAKAYIDGNRETVYLFCARLCYSCRPIVLAYHRQNEESFLDAFVSTFDLLGGVPSRVIFDNGKVAVKDGFGACARKQAGYTALSAHYAFDAVFCNPAQGHEKGLVEGLVGWSRRNILVPVPRVRDIGELNTLLLARCTAYEKHQIKGRPAPVGEMLIADKENLHALPGYRFDAACSINARVSAFSTVNFRTNSYSVPVRFVGDMVGVKGYPETVQIYYRGELIATHQRCFGHRQKIYQLEHYLPLLEHRSRAILDAAPVKQNVPPEVMEELRRMNGDHSRMISYLREFAGSKGPDIKDPVKIPAVNLLQYDELTRRREAARNAANIS